MRKGDIIELTIEKLAFGGMGLGKYEDRTIFVPGTLPGDKISVSLTKVKSNFAEGQLVQLISPSKRRTTPRCRHFGTCGGCQLQFLPYPDQVSIKENLVKETLQHIGGFSDIEILPIIPADKQWYYRNKMEFTFAPDERGNLNVGLHPPRQYRRVFDLKECFLQSSLDAFLVECMRQFAKKYELRPYDYHVNTGLLRSFYIRSGKRTGEIMINLVTSHEEFHHQNACVDWLLKQTDSFLKSRPPDDFDLPKPQIVSIYHSSFVVQKGQRSAVNETLLYGTPYYRDELHITHRDKTIILTFTINPQAFFQPNPLQAEKLYAKVLDAAMVSEHETVFDLFCGTGTIALCIAPFAKHVIGIESNPHAIENARRSAIENKLKNVDFVLSDADKAFEKGQAQANVIIVDPPRAGLTTSLIEKISHCGSSKIVYVSCNTSTFARDAQLLTRNGYIFEWVQPIDMLPHTSHIETIASFRNNA